MYVLYIDKEIEFLTKDGIEKKEKVRFFYSLEKGIVNSKEQATFLKNEIEARNLLNLIPYARFNYCKYSNEYED